MVSQSPEAERPLRSRAVRRFLVPGLVVATAIALLALLAFGISNQGTNSSIDSAVARGIHPALPGANTPLPVLGSSGRASLTGFRGKVVVVNVFASWCPPCQAEAPILDREQRTLAKHGGTIVGIDYEDTPGDAQAFVRQQHITYPILRDLGGNLSHRWGVNGVPETFVLDRQGRVVNLRREQLAGSWLSEAVAPLLAHAS